MTQVITGNLEVDVRSKLSARIAELEAKLAAAQAQANKPRAIALKVTQEKLDPKTGKMTGTNGAVSLYGMGRFPVTLYGSQWERLLNEADTIRAFLKANAALLSVKEAK